MKYKIEPRTGKNTTTSTQIILSFPENLFFKIFINAMQQKRNHSIQGIKNVKISIASPELGRDRIVIKEGVRIVRIQFIKDKEFGVM